MREDKLSQPAAGGQQDDFNYPGGPAARAAFTFLDFLFGKAAGGFVEFRYFGAGPKPKVVDDSTYVPLPLDEERRELILRDVISRSGQQAITVGLAPRFQRARRGEAGKDRDVLQVGCVWADIDLKQTEGGIIEIIERVHRLPLRPSVVVDSGYGRHVYYVFNTYLRDSGLLEWQQLIGDLRTTLQGDPVTNISRVMRLPGTLNIKFPDAVPCVICEEESSWTRYGFDEVKVAVRQALAARNAAAAGAREEGVGVPLDELKRRGVYDDVIEAIITGQRTIRSGPNAGRSDDESGRDFWVATTLLEKGFSGQEIKDIFRAHPHGCGSKWAQKRHGESYLDLTLRKAVERYEEKRATRAAAAPGDGQEEEAIENRLPPCYEFAGDGSIWFVPPVADEDKKPAPRVKVCNSFLEIVEIQESVDTGQISVVVAFDYLGRTRRTTLLRSQMADVRQLVAGLAGEGAPVSSINARHVLSYLTAYEHAFISRIPRKRVTCRFGRGRLDSLNGAFFLPGLSSDIEFAPAGPGDQALYRAYASRRGTLEGWVDTMGVLDSEALMIPQVAVLSTFIPPLQSRLQIPNFIIDINGNTSTGKSTSLKLAASVYGRPHDPDSLVMQWMNTKVAIEQVAAMCSELPVFLDDAQHCGDDMKKAVIYMIANGRGKGRGARGGGLRETPTWHTVALSTSEEPLYESSPHEGARGRILPLGGATPPFRPGSGPLVQALERVISQNHGHAGEAFIRHINNWTQGDWADRSRRYTAIRGELLRSSSSDLVGRVSGYIAAIQLAAEIVCPLLGLPFKPDAVGTWLMFHLIEQQSDQNLVLHALRALGDHYVSNQGLFARLDRPEAYESRGTFDGDSFSRNLQGAVRKQQYVAFLRSALEAVFEKRKWNVTAVLNKMAEAGVLYATEGDRHTKKVSVEGVKHRMICIKWSRIFPDDQPEKEDF